MKNVLAQNYSWISGKSVGFENPAKKSALANIG